MVEGTSVLDVLRKARETLSAAQLGLSDLVGSVPDRRGMGASKPPSAALESASLKRQRPSGTCTMRPGFTPELADGSD